VPDTNILPRTNNKIIYPEYKMLSINDALPSTHNDNLNFCSPWNENLHSSIFSCHYQQNHTAESLIYPLEECQVRHSKTKFKRRVG
jgi:hypothetical protein